MNLQEPVEYNIYHQKKLPVQFLIEYGVSTGISKVMSFV